jgi:tight adherence protein C
LPLLLGSGAIGLAIALAVWLVAAPRPRTSAEELVAGAQEAQISPIAPAPAAPSNRADEDLAPLYQRLRQLAARLSPADYGPRLQRRLDLAGNPRGYLPDRVLAFKGIALVLGAMLGILVGLHHGIVILLAPPGIAAFGFFVPDIIIRNLGEKRQIELQKGLPDALDMMTVCVEAGLGFDAAIMRVALNLEGPVASEWARVLQEMQFGMSRTEALRALVSRTDVPELRTFVSSLIQSAELGISVGIVLREQAKEMRIRRRQRAEERAQKLPVKILMPLISCLLPAMFVVVLGPAIIQIVHTLGNLNS